MLIRAICWTLLAAGLFSFAGNQSIAQQDKKQKPQRIAVNEPNEAAKDPDFAIQGEYVGEGTEGDGNKEKIGAQVIAQGNGQFVVRTFRGGLPGDGWNQEDEKTVSAKREDGTVVVYGDGEKVGTIAEGKIQLSAGTFSATLNKAERKSPTLGAKPPEGAKVLFAGPGDEDNWANGKLVELSDGKFLGMGTKSKDKFQGFKAHIEFRLPWMPNSRGQGRGNSGVYLQDRYEVQVLDSFGLQGKNNECGGIYQQHDPSVNMCLPPMVWQTFDIEFTPAQFDDSGKRTAPARTTVVHNGVKIQDNVELKGSTGGGQPEMPTPGPFQLQNHGDPLVFRNIWVVEK